LFEVVGRRVLPSTQKIATMAQLLPFIRNLEYAVEEIYGYLHF
jgi:hypothetical protein